MYDFRYWLNVVDDCVLREGRDAPLYHATDINSAEAILASNRLEARTDQRLQGKTLHGVSLTRTPRFTQVWAKVKYGDNAPIVTFVLDQAKLSAENCIAPIDWFQTYEPDIVQLELDGKAFGDTPYQRRQYPYMKDEEFVLGDVRHLKRKLQRIIFTPTAVHDVKRNQKRYFELSHYM